MNNQENIVMFSKFKKYAYKNETFLQIGGLGGATTYYNEHPKFKDYNQNARRTMIFAHPEIDDSAQFNSYNEELKNLFMYDKGIINYEFMENFHRHVYYDLSDDFELVTTDGTLAGTTKGTTFKKNGLGGSKIPYDIDPREIHQAHGNTSVYFLKHTSGNPDKNYVLKVFNTVPIDISAIPDYLSLEIIHIDEKGAPLLESQKNYVHVTKEAFDTLNFNMIDDFIETNNNTHLYLASKNNNAVNEYLINLILQHTNTELNLQDAFVKYINFFVTKVNGSYKYCLLMKSYTGSISGLFQKIKNKDFVLKSSWNELYASILKSTETTLNKLKTRKHLFTHTDMKLENLFYNLAPVTNGGDFDISGKDSQGNDQKYKILVYIADFDKSSITHHNIRFYNSQAPIDSQSSLRTWLVDKRVVEEKNIRVVKYKEAVQNSIIESTYKYSGIGSTFREMYSNTNIETEQLYMRYNYLPYHMTFDMISLIISIFWEKLLEKKEGTLDTIVNKYISQWQSLHETFINYMGSHYDGNFGAMLNPILGYSSKRPYQFISKIIKEKVQLIINKLYLTSDNKICLSLPFIAALPMRAKQRESVLERVDAYYIGIDALQTMNKFKDVFPNEIGLFVSRGISSENPFVIDYNEDIDPEIIMDMILVKRNRSSKTPLTFTELLNKFGRFALKIFTLWYAKVKRDRIITEINIVTDQEIETLKQFFPPINMV